MYLSRAKTVTVCSLSYFWWEGLDVPDIIRPERPVRFQPYASGVRSFPTNSGRHYKHLWLPEVESQHRQLWRLKIESCHVLSVVSAMTFSTTFINFSSFASVVFSGNSRSTKSKLELSKYVYLNLQYHNRFVEFEIEIYNNNKLGILGSKMMH